MHCNRMDGLADSVEHGASRISGARGMACADSSFFYQALQASVHRIHSLVIALEEKVILMEHKDKK